MVGLGSPKPTTIILQLVDRSVARSEGVEEDVLAQVGSLIFPIDFVVLNFEFDPEVPFILRKPFFETGRAMIDVAARELSMRTHYKVEFLDVSLIMTTRDRLEPLNRVLGPPPKPSIEEEPNLEIKNTTVPPQLMCDASDIAFGVVFGQRKEKVIFGGNQSDSSH
ncbi:uncharacterized protein LOC107016547 [Solanum pennellii]|uniref:Uncharacterized protein LOC107016547 n=1 Tax=Solanum pennellii TaxID=28526 RepID=A0ABM1GKS8_SOLPN|nr:uncharacterized protein LOC107016547 [Solanum pennellii]